MRPYAMTGGRTRPRYQLAVEALVHTIAQPHELQGQLPEHQRICSLCHEVRSVAEISALLAVPLGVARILVADLAEAGLVAVHQPDAHENPGGRPGTDLLERVLHGLRRFPSQTAQAGAGTTGAGGVPGKKADLEQEHVHRAAQEYGRLVGGLHDVLGTEDGLLSVALRGDYERLVEDAGGVLDVERGLRQALEGQAEEESD